MRNISLINQSPSLPFGLSVASRSPHLLRPLSDPVDAKFVRHLVEGYTRPGIFHQRSNETELLFVNIAVVVKPYGFTNSLSIPHEFCRHCLGFNPLKRLDGGGQLVHFGGGHDRSDFGEVPSIWIIFAASRDGGAVTIIPLGYGPGRANRRRAPGRSCGRAEGEVSDPLC